METERWTSPIYQIQFGAVESITEENDEYSFDTSAWGISTTLWRLLADYSRLTLRTSIEWLTAHQNQMVADILENLAYDSHRRGEPIPPLQHVFIAVESELYMPRGLRLPVICVTNIVPHGDEEDSMDKFVAVLDPGEAELYINERTGNNRPHHDDRIH